MANYDNRLGEWFKQVERSAQELKKKKTDDGPEEEPQSVVMAKPIAAAPAAEIIAQPVQEASAMQRSESAVATIDMVDDDIVGEPRLQTQMASAAQDMPIAAPKSSPVLFDDADIPQVEDFFSFLGHKSEPEETELEPPVAPVLIGSEGTGEPRPIVSDNVITLPAEPVKAEAPLIAEQPVAQQDNLQENWDRMPHHLQTLFGIAGEEVAQNSYKAFKETRGGLIQRLLDPPLTLEEAARILNVCPTTVRRYTNRGVLAHFRTAGNQRRFRLSDVLSFMENNGHSIENAE